MRKESWLKADCNSFLTIVLLYTIYIYTLYHTIYIIWYIIQQLLFSLLLQQSSLYPVINAHDFCPHIWFTSFVEWKKNNRALTILRNVKINKCSLSNTNGDLNATWYQNFMQGAVLWYAFAIEPLPWSVCVKDIESLLCGRGFLICVLLH